MVSQVEERGEREDLPFSFEGDCERAMEGTSSGS